MGRHLMCVMTSPTLGKEQEFQRWYDEQHVPDVLRVPGIVSAQRFALSAVQHKPPPFQQTFMAIYEIETDDLGVVNAEILRRVGTPAMPLSDALGPGFVRYLLDPVTSKRFAADADASEAAAPADRP